MNKITDVLWWINSEVDKLSASALPRVEEILGAAQAELAHDLSRSKWLGTDDKYTAQVHRNAMNQIESALDHIKRQTGPDFEETIKLGTIRAGRLAAAHVVSEVEKFSSIYEGTVRPVALEAMTVLAEGKKTLWPRHKNSAARYSGDIGRDIRKQLGIGVIKGETIDQLTNRLSRHGGPRGVVYTRGREGSPNARAEIISEGLFKRYRYWGERLARTELVNAYNECALIGMDELEADDPGYFKRWDAAIDGRLCPLCREFDDLVVPLNKTFPGGFAKPPRHPNCRCACVIWRKEWNEADHKDDLLMPVKQGKEPGSIASVPHRIQTPEPDYKAEAGRRMSKPGKKPPGIVESAPASMTRLAEPPATRTRAPRRSSAEVQAERQARDLARIVRNSERAARAMAQDEARQARQLQQIKRRTQRAMDQMARDEQSAAANKARVMAKLDAQAEKRERRFIEQNRQRLEREQRKLVKTEARNTQLRNKQMIRDTARSFWTHDPEFPSPRQLSILAERTGMHPIDVQQIIGREYALRSAKPGVSKTAQAKSDLRAEQALKPQDRANLKAVRDMASQPMAETMHPSITFAPSLGVKSTVGGDAGWTSKITVGEASHAFAAPPGYRGEITGISAKGIEIQYYTTAAQKTKDGTVIPAGSKAAELRRDFYNATNTEIHHSLFVVDNKLRNDGFADTINGQAMLRYEKWGIKKISVDAAWVGRYKWAKMGFSFNEPEAIYNRGKKYIAEFVPKAKQAEYLEKLKVLVNEPWNLADWDEGTKHPAKFHLPEGVTSEGNHHIGKAILLHADTMPMWSGNIEVGGEHPGYLRALDIVQANQRK